MKVRIVPNSPYFKFKVQVKKWWGWKTLYRTDLIYLAERYAEDCAKLPKFFG